MLAVQAEFRGQGIGTIVFERNTNLLATELVERALAAMMQKGADEVIYQALMLTRFKICLETETTNQAAMSLYENMGFVRYKRLHRYYLNAGDAIRFILPIKHPAPKTET